jgi:hypothetical protein
MHTYTKADRHPDLETIYAQCGEPRGLKLAEFIAEKMQQAAAWYHQRTDKKGIV